MSDCPGSPSISEFQAFRSEARKGCKKLLAALLYHHPELAPDSLKCAIGLGLLRSLQASRDEPEKLPAPVVVSERWGPSWPWPLPNRIGDHPVSIAMMASAIHFGLDRSDLRSHSRKPRFALARQVAWHVAKAAAPNLTLPDIGRRCGNRDHTTVLHGIQTIPKKIADGRLTEADVAAVTRLYRQMKKGIDNG